jgi:23S rRNA (uracil1939-C5)-methyltransferase
MSETTQTATPRCPHFGVCGGCQHQDIAYDEQLSLKHERLTQLLREAGLTTLPNIATHSAEPYEYRNRIRLRIERIESADGIGGTLRFGYNRPTTTDFLPITTCPIAAPILIQTAEALLAIAATDRDAAYWLNATHELELFVNDDLSRVQMALFCASRTKSPQGSFIRMMNALQPAAPQVIGAEVQAFDPRTGPTGRILDSAGQPGLNYRVNDETYWITRGGFFQVNRFLIAKLVDLVTRTSDGTARVGTLAWDLFAGVGLFSRILARNFAQVTAVESNPSAAQDLRTALTRLGKQHTTVEATTLAFLQRATTQRERPELIVLDPPRAGAGIEACELISRLAPQQIVYVSCDPMTLARDLTTLQLHYSIAELHLVDLFPQTAHLETVVTLHRKS